MAARQYGWGIFFTADFVVGGTTNPSDIGGRVPKGDPFKTGQRPGTFNTGWLQRIYQEETRTLQDRTVEIIKQPRQDRPRSGRLAKATANRANLVGLAQGTEGLRNFGLGVGDPKFLDRSIAKYWRITEEGTKSNSATGWPGVPTWIGPMVDRQGVPLYGLWSSRILKTTGKAEDRPWPPYDRRVKGKPRLRVPWSQYRSGRTDGKLRPFSVQKRQEIADSGKYPIPYRNKHVVPMHAYRRAWLEYMGANSEKHWARIEEGLRQQGYPEEAIKQMLGSVLR